ncbi:exostosin, partial [Blyttiomyces helicus]
FSVLIGTWDRIELLLKLIGHYRESPLVEKIYVTWHNPNAAVPSVLLELGRADNTTTTPQPPVEILPQRTNSLNNRFNPIAGLDTKAVLIVDEDVRIPIKDLALAFRTWRLHPESLTGFFPRRHRKRANGDWDYLLDVKDGYDMMLTKGMFIDAEMLFAYTCLLPLSIHAYVDRMRNCEDIAFNMLASGLTGKMGFSRSSPLFIALVLTPSTVMSNIDDFGTSGISSASGHLESRQSCLGDLIALFGRDNLVSNDLMITRIKEVPVHFKSLDHW